MQQTHYGSHLMGDLNGCTVRDGEYLYRFLKDLVHEIGMEAMGSPHLDLYTGPHKEWDGFSATVHIQSSHVTIHIFAFGYVFIDIFSCTPIDVARAQHFIMKAFEPDHDSWQFVRRGFNFPSNLIDPSMNTENGDAIS